MTLIWTKNLSALKTITANGTGHSHLLLSGLNVFLSVIDYGFGLKTFSQFKLLKADRVHNINRIVVLETRKDLPSMTVRYLWDLLRKIQSIHFMMLSKVDPSHVWAKQNGRCSTSVI